MNLGGPRALTMETLMLKMKYLRVFRPVVADTHHPDEEQYGIRIRSCKKVKSGSRSALLKREIWIRLKVMRIRNPGYGSGP
jgi:hypothetical protein